MGHNGIFINEAADSIEANVEQFKDKPTTTASVIGRPVLLSLEEIDGSPSFLEKAFRFIEEQGVKVEGILRQSADVEEVMHRVQEYEQGKTEFTPDEDAHVIGDCIKHVLREMPSSPVPASCCISLVDAYRTYRGSRVKNIRDAIFETFPEPNRRLLQRTLQMILTVATHKAENRMSLSALAACMAPLLLRPLLAGECELNNDFEIDRDGSFQLLQAAAAANHAQAIVIVLLEKFKNIFYDESFSPEPCTESEDDVNEDDESTDNEVFKEDGYHEAQNDLKADAGGDTNRSYSRTSSGSDKSVGEDSNDFGSDVGSEVDSDVSGATGCDVGNDAGSNIKSDAGCDVYNIGGNVVRNDAGSDIWSNLSRNQDIKDISAHAISARNNESVENITINSNKISLFLHEDVYNRTSTSSHVQLPPDVISFETADSHKDDDLPSKNTSSNIPFYHKSSEPTVAVPSTVVPNKLAYIKPSSSSIIKTAEQSSKAYPTMRNKWGRTSARKNLSVESIEYISDDESVVQRLESAKIDLQTKLSEEIKENVVLQSRLDGRKQARLSLEKDVLRLKELLQNERDLRSHLESGLMSTQPDNLSTSACLDSKIKADLEEIALSLRDIDNLKLNVIDLNEQLLQGRTIFCPSCGQPIYSRDVRLEDADNIPNEHEKDNSLKHDNMKDEAKHSTFLKEGQTCPKLLPTVPNHNVARYSETSSAQDRHGGSKKLLRWECTKKDASESSSRRMSSQKKQLTIAPLNSEKSKEIEGGQATRRHASKSEEGSSSFALTKLTNRLNFLKERRTQLANELQNLDSSRSSPFFENK